jgi:5-bromo-4-chloroindolyl phosphate hydrolysis protein
MATKKQNSYISAELEMAEAQLKQWAKYMADNPIDQIKDRWGKKEMPKGGHTMVVTSTAENQIKCVQDTLSKYLQLLEVVDKLREKEEQKQKSVRGKQTLSPAESGEI